MNNEWSNSITNSLVELLAKDPKRKFVLSLLRHMNTPLFMPPTKEHSLLTGIVESHASPEVPGTRAYAFWYQNQVAKRHMASLQLHRPIFEAGHRVHTALQLATYSGWPPSIHYFAKLSPEIDAQDPGSRGAIALMIRKDNGEQWMHFWSAELTSICTHTKVIQLSCDVLNRTAAQRLRT